METTEPTYQTLIFIKTKNRELWLGRKKRGFGKGILNGYGGKVMSGETSTNCILRELEEESFLKLDENSIIYLGYNEYYDIDRRERRIVYMYTTVATDEQPKESEEIGQPEKYSFDSIPYHQLWPDAIYWMHLVLQQYFFKGTFVLKGNNVKKVRVDILDKPPKQIV